MPHEYDAKVPTKYRIPASKVTTDKMADGETSYKQYLLDLCQKRGDELGRTVRDSILGASSDLHATDAKYCRKCNASFHYGTRRGNSTDSNSIPEDLAFTELLMLLVVIAQKSGTLLIRKPYTAIKVDLSCLGVS